MKIVEQFFELNPFDTTVEDFQEAFDDPSADTLDGIYGEVERLQYAAGEYARKTAKYFAKECNLEKKHLQHGLLGLAYPTFSQIYSLDEFDKTIDDLDSEGEIEERFNELKAEQLNPIFENLRTRALEARFQKYICEVLKKHEAKTGDESIAMLYCWYLSGNK